jgi:hypothetical protein
MRLSGVKVGDIVQCDVRGQRFFARVDQADGHWLEVGSLNGVQLGYRRLSSRQIVGHYRRAKNSA